MKFDVAFDEDPEDMWAPALTSSARRKELDTNDVTLFNNSRYSDLIIQRHSRSWNAHRSIVCTRSKYFAKSCNGEQSHVGCISLPDGDTNAIHAMLQYLYTGDYDENACKHKDEYRPMRLNMLVFVVSERYELPGLSCLAHQRFADGAAKEWRDPVFAAIVEGLYDFPLDPKLQKLRALVVSICADNATEIFTGVGASSEDADWTKISARGHLRFIQGVLDNTPRVGADLAARLARMAVVDME